MSDKRSERPLLKREPRRFWYFISAGVCAAMLVVAARGDLGLFIHPRYNTFTILMLLAATLLLVSAAFQYKYKGLTHIEYSRASELLLLFGRWLFGKGAWITIIVIVLLLFVPPKPLLSAAADRKPLTQYEMEYIEFSTWFYQPQTIYQLSSVLQLEKGLDAQLGESFTLSGFVRQDNDPNVMLLSRFVMSCCAVDARPVSIAVYMPGWQEKYAVDQWVEVTGKLELVHGGAGQRVVLQPANVRHIEEPSEPYDYI